MLLDSTEYHWREGFPHPKKDVILFRFATKSDKKNSKIKISQRDDKDSHTNFLINDDNIEMENVITNNPWGDLCKSWGVYDHQEVFHRPLLVSDSDDNDDGIIQIKNKKLAKRLGKRHHKTEEFDDSNSDSEWKRKQKTPRMRMHADDEELLEKKKKLQIQIDTKIVKTENDFTPLSIEIVNTDTTSQILKSTTKLSDKFKTNIRRNHIHHHKDNNNIQSRLGIKLSQTDDAFSTDESSDGYIDANISSKVHKIVAPITKKSCDVWSRLDKKSSEVEATFDDLRHKLKKTKPKNTNDLRKRIGKDRKGRSPLRIEVDNEYYGNSE